MSSFFKPRTVAIASMALLVIAVIFLSVRHYVAKERELAALEWSKGAVESDLDKSKKLLKARTDELETAKEKTRVALDKLKTPGYSIVLAYDKRCETARGLLKVAEQRIERIPDLKVDLLALASGWSTNNVHSWVVSYGRGSLGLEEARALVGKMGAEGIKTMFSRAEEIYWLDRLAFAANPACSGALPTYPYTPDTISWGSGLPRTGVYRSSTLNCKVGTERGIAKPIHSADECRKLAQARVAYEGAIKGRLVIWWPPVFGEWPKCACTPADSYSPSMERAFAVR